MSLRHSMTSQTQNTCEWTKDIRDEVFGAHNSNSMHSKLFQRSVISAEKTSTLNRHQLWIQRSMTFITSHFGKRECAVESCSARK